MGGAVRTYIASADALRLEALLGRDPLFSVVGSASDGEEAVRGLFSVCPDFLIFDAALPGLDGLTLLEKMSAEMPAPPRVLCLCASPEWADWTRKKDADCALIVPCSEDVLLEKIRETSLLSLPHLALPWEPVRMEIAENLLDQLGVSDRYKGKQYMKAACAMLACSPLLAASYTGRLYPYLAKTFSVTAPSVERAIRTAIEDTWLHGDLEAIQRLFGLSVDADRGKPTNAEFLSMLAEHVRRETKRRMRNMG